MRKLVLASCCVGVLAQLGVGSSAWAQTSPAGAPATQPPAAKPAATQTVPVPISGAAAAAGAAHAPPPPPVAVVVPPAPAVDPEVSAAAKPGSDFVKCDGAPPISSPAELAARIVLIMATAGLAGPGEMPNVSRRLEGAEGVASCDAAIRQDTNPTRKVQLTLARAIHNIEAKKFEAALADARSVPTVAGALADDRGFKRSLLVSSYELQAAALVRLGRPAEAEAAALNMSANAPYDYIAYARAFYYVGLTPEMTPAKRDYLSNIARLWPRGLTKVSDLDTWAGDYKAAADDMFALSDVSDGFSAEKTSAPALVAAASVDYALAGDMAKSNALAADARAQIDAWNNSGKAMNLQAIVAESEESLDFQAIVRLWSEGRIPEARAALGGRSHWFHPGAPGVALMVERLRQGAAPGDLHGVLARDPAQIRSEAMAQRAGAILANPNADKLLYGAIRPLEHDSDYANLPGAIWKAEKSPYLIKRTGKETFQGEMIYMSGVYGLPAGKVLLLHAALIAKSRGASAFVTAPNRVRLDSAYFRFGAAGDPGLPRQAVFDTEPGPVGRYAAALSWPGFNPGRADDEPTFRRDGRPLAVRRRPGARTCVGAGVHREPAASLSPADAADGAIHRRAGL